MDTPDLAPNATSVAEIATPQASRYLQQLCKHFAHKRPVAFDETAGRIEFTIGTCRLEAGEGILRLMLDAPQATDMPQLQDVVVRHLERFAFRETLAIDWRPA
jgi:hypothetical protein